MSLLVRAVVVAMLGILLVLLFAFNYNPKDPAAEKQTGHRLQLQAKH
jgi:hypothetical protein